MKPALLLLALALTGCATVPHPATSPFERCMATLKGVDYVGTKIESAKWCRENENGGIK